MCVVCGCGCGTFIPKAFESTKDQPNEKMLTPSSSHCKTGTRQCEKKTRNKYIYIILQINVVLVQTRDSFDIQAVNSINFSC